MLKKIGGGICHAIHRYPEGNNKYRKNYNKNKELSYLMCLDAYDLYEWGMSEKLFVNCFKWKKFHWFNKEFIKNYDEDSDKGYILEVDVEYPRNLYNLHSDLPFYQKE